MEAEEISRMLLRYEAAIKPMLDRTKRLRVIPAPIEATGSLATIAEALDATLASVACGYTNPEIAFRRLHEGAISIAAPMVVEAFKAAGFEPHGHEIIWRLTQEPATV